jgi:hypothetical protein
MRIAEIMSRTELLDQVYYFFNFRDSKISRQAFSIHWLGMSPNYYGYVRCSGRPPSDIVFLRLACRLRDHWKKLEGTEIAPKDRAELLKLAKKAFLAGRNGTHTWAERMSR